MSAKMTSRIYDLRDAVSRPRLYPVDMNLLQNAENLQLTQKALELSGALQTTLDIPELLQLFLNHTQAAIGYEGVRYQNPALGIEFSFGEQSRHTCSYHLSLTQDELGEIRFFKQTRFSETSLRRLENRLCALVYPLRNALRYQEALRSAFIDPLTGVNNRAAMDITLKREVDLGHRQSAPLSVILMDIDHFKRINDRFGHATGDQALRAVALCAKESIRGSDMLFRYGGEEFLILLSYTEIDGAFRLGERVRHNIGQMAPISDSDNLTVSLGVATLQASETVNQLLKRADAALYKAKESGRNRVVTA